MTRDERENALHCLKVMIDEEVCEECKLYGSTGTDHCEKDCVRIAIKTLEKEIALDKIMAETIDMRIEQNCSCSDCLDSIRQAEQEVETELDGVETELEDCEDCISRKALINAFPISDTYTLNAIIATIRFQPSVTPKPRAGKWIDKKCSVCGWHINPWIEEYNFCPFCGARMESEE